MKADLSSESSRSEQAKAAGEAFAELTATVELLRNPGGCPWDAEQTHVSLRPNLLEETYETLEAIDSGDSDGLAEELGDIMIQILFHADIARREDGFDAAAVCNVIREKMIARHPHVFGDETVADAEAQTTAWEETKAIERAKSDAKGALEGVARGLPALLRALKLQKRAARVRFDWPDVAGAMDKLREELDEFDAELEAPAGADMARVKDEFGDVLFSLVNVARKLDMDPEDALRQANAKFEGRFGYMEDALIEAGRSMQDADLDEMMHYWDQAKAKKQVAEPGT